MDHIQESLSFGRLCCLFCLCLYYFLLSSMSRWYMYFYLDLFFLLRNCSFHVNGNQNNGLQQNSFPGFSPTHPTLSPV